MPRWLQITLHLLGTAAAVYASIKTGSPIPTVVLGAASATIGGIAQSFNTDGTPQSVPFDKTADTKLISGK